MSEDETVVQKCITMADLLSETRRKSYKKRCVARVIFNLGNAIHFSVKLYNLVR